VSDEFGFLDGAKGLTSSLNASREVGKELSKTISDIQKDVSDVAQQRSLDRRREIRENEIRKELFLKRVVIAWEHEEYVRREEARLKQEFLKKYGKRWAEVEALKAKLEKREKELQSAFDSDLSKARWAQFWCFAVAAWIAYFIVWGSK
jgi:vacuolar-type H+-ATPase subunit I/STV1